MLQCIVGEEIIISAKSLDLRYIEIYYPDTSYYPDGILQ